MKALSIRQPWAWLVCAGHKHIENRNWPTSFRGMVYIHAGLRPDISCGTEIMEGYAAEFIIYARYTKPMPFGAVIGEVEIIDCVEKSHSRWFTGPYGFVLEKPRLYAEPIPCRGALRFFEPLIAHYA